MASKARERSIRHADTWTFIQNGEAIEGPDFCKYLMLIDIFKSGQASKQTRLKR
tara:strand:+ start:183 stop:344 length:162 start_codon:yes stop_codon:yes gene_type:complete